MRLTLDSSEPLQDAIRVLGALYGVTLVVANHGSVPNEPTQQPTSRPKRSATQPRNGAGVAHAVAKRSRRGTAASSAAAASNAEVRAWARQAGVTVSDRGRVPESVMSAYRSAHQ